MKKLHHKKLKFHTLFSAAIATLLAAVLVFARDLSLALATILLILYVAGNGIIHNKQNILHRDTIIEYSLVAIVVVVIILGALL